VVRCIAVQGGKPKALLAITLHHKLNEAIAQAANAIIKDNGILVVGGTHNLILSAHQGLSHSLCSSVTGAVRRFWYSEQHTRQK
jgi:hypothetical protein